MHKSSLRLQRQPSFSYAAAESHQKDPGHLLDLVHSALGSVSHDSDTASQKPKVLYKKLGQDDRPFLTTNPESSEQQAIERDPLQYDGQRQAAIGHVCRSARLWSEDLQAAPGFDGLATDAWITLCETYLTQNEGLPCTDQLERLVRSLNEAYQAGQVAPCPQARTAHQPRSPRFTLPSLKSYGQKSPNNATGSPPTSPRPTRKQHPHNVHAPGRPVVTLRFQEPPPEQREVDSPGTPAATNRPLPKPPARHQREASAESGTDTSSTSRNDGSPTKGSPEKHHSPRARLQKKPPTDLSDVRAKLREQRREKKREVDLAELHDLFFPLDIGALPVGTPPGAPSIPALPTRTIKAQPQPRPSIRRKPETSSTPAQAPSSTPEDQPPQTDTP